jgi:hypothetical protein
MRESCASASSWLRCSDKVAPFARFIIAITSALLFVRDSVAPFSPRRAAAGDDCSFTFASGDSGRDVGRNIKSIVNDSNVGVGA